MFRLPPPAGEEFMLADFDRFGMPAHLIEAHYERFATEPGLLTAALNWYRAGGFPKPAKTSVPTLFIASTADVAIARSGIEDTASWVAAPYRPGTPARRGSFRARGSPGPDIEAAPGSPHPGPVDRGAEGDPDAEGASGAEGGPWRKPDHWRGELLGVVQVVAGGRSVVGKVMTMSATGPGMLPCWSQARPPGPTKTEPANTELYVYREHDIIAKPNED
ncbi:hypothetical protein [Streptomyces sp. NPDC096339]|uniref:hypothetical protein n=1 Tax=Streptomyces sp. NPDC096339 TaxID=3366086 RepID=UPI003800E7FB